MLRVTAIKLEGAAGAFEISMGPSGLSLTNLTTGTNVYCVSVPDAKGKALDDWRWSTADAVGRAMMGDGGGQDGGRVYDLLGCLLEGTR